MSVAAQARPIEGLSSEQRESSERPGRAASSLSEELVQTLPALKARWMNLAGIDEEGTRAHVR